MNVPGVLVPKPTRLHLFLVRVVRRQSSPSQMCATAKGE